MTPKSLATHIHKLALKNGSDEVYNLLCRLAGTVSKQYSAEEQIDALIEECEEWDKDPKCFNS